MSNELDEEKLSDVSVGTGKNSQKFADMGSSIDKRYYILDESLPFSQSSLWDSVRNFYSEKGPSAWQEGLVPSHITSNCFIANNYATLLLSFMYDSKRAKQEGVDEPVYIFELGAGHGKFGYLVVKKLLEQQANSPELYGDLSFVYVMTDFAFSNIKFWHDHPKLKEFVSLGLMDFALFDCEHDTDVTLFHSQRKIALNTLKNDVAVIGNYIFDSLRCEHYRIREGILEEGLITVVVPNEAAEKNLKEEIAKDSLKKCAEEDNVAEEEATLKDGVEKVSETADDTNPSASTGENLSGTPTAAPTNLPTENPTDVPTPAPSMAPTDTPGTPTAASTNLPTENPTDVPTPAPSMAPTDTPDVPTFQLNGIEFPMTEANPPRPVEGLKKFEPMDLDKPPPCTDMNGNTTKQTKDMFPMDLEDSSEPSSRQNSAAFFDSYISVDDGKSEDPKIKTFHRLDELERLQLLADINPNKLLHWFDYIGFEENHRTIPGSSDTMDYILKLYLRQLVYTNRVQTEKEKMRRQKRPTFPAPKSPNAPTAKENSEKEKIIQRNQFNTSFLYPTGVNQCLERMRSWSSGACMVITADKGYTSKCGPSGLREPHLAMHGCISTMVNFHAVGHYVNCHGGFHMSSELQESSIKVSTYVLPSMGTPLAITIPDACKEKENGVSSLLLEWQTTPPPPTAASPIKSLYPDLLRNFNSMNLFGPYDFFSLEVCITREVEQPSANLALRLLRLSCYDPDVYYRFADAFLGEDVITDPSLQEDITQAIERTWENFYVLERDHDVAFQIARYFFVLEQYATALEFFDYSIDEMGESYCTVFDKGLCFYYSNNFGEAKKMFANSIEINPSIDEKANEWIKRCERAEELIVQQNCVDIKEVMELVVDHQEVMKKPLPDITAAIAAVIPAEGEGNPKKL